MPTHSASLKDALSPAAAIGLPVAWGVVAGGAGAVIAGSMAWHNGDPQPLAIAGLAGGATFGLAWLRAMSWWGGLVGDLVGRPAPAVDPAAYAMHTTRVEVVASDPDQAYQVGVYADLPLSRERLQEVAKRVIERGAGFSHAGLAGPHRPLSRAEFEALRDEFIGRGLAAWENPHSHSRGVVLTAAGRAVLRRFAGIEPRHSPTLQPAEMVEWLKSLERRAYTHTHT